MGRGWSGWVSAGRSWGYSVLMVSCSEVGFSDEPAEPAEREDAADQQQHQGAASEARGDFTVDFLVTKLLAETGVDGAQPLRVGGVERLSAGDLGDLLELLGRRGDTLVDEVPVL